MKKFFPLAVLALLLASCSHYNKDLPPGTVLQIDTPVLEQQTVVVPPAAESAPREVDYLLGPGDVLSVVVYGRSDMSGAAGGSGTSASKGSRIDGKGDIQLPLVGSVRVQGLTVVQARDRIQEQLRKYIRDPSVVVEVAEYHSHPLYLLGQFRLPGVHYMERPVDVVEGLALGNGLDPTANLRGARLIRNGKIVPVDIYGLLHDGDQRQNLPLLAGDTIYVPDSTLQNVFVFGAVKNPGTIPLKNGQMTLHQAIAAAGGLGDSGHERNIRIIRSLSPTRGELIVVDLDRILSGETRPYQLVDGDIVYVPKSFIANWNQAIGEILPTLQAVGAILNPFVQIKFLTEK